MLVSKHMKLYSCRLDGLIKKYATNLYQMKPIFLKETSLQLPRNGMRTALGFVKHKYFKVNGNEETCIQARSRTQAPTYPGNQTTHIESRCLDVTQEHSIVPEKNIAWDDCDADVARCNGYHCRMRGGTEH